jgi:hypothetical protein
MMSTETKEIPMNMFFRKALRLATLVTTMLFALSFSLLCFASVVWFAVKLTPDRFAVFDKQVVMGWQQSVFDPSWMVCMASIAALLVLEFSYSKLKTSKNDTPP